MKPKFLIPVLAIIFAVAMSFTTVAVSADPSSDYIFRNGNWHQIPEMSCTNNSQKCYVEVLPEGNIFEIYDSQSLSNPKPGNGDVVGEITLD